MVRAAGRGGAGPEGGYRMTRALVSFGGLLAVGLAVVFELDRRVGRLVRIWRNERTRRARRGYVR